jgi:probable F420-dependent oxidoreductase
MRPFRFGIIAEHAQTADALLETARRAEAAGLSTLLLRDHLVEGPFLHQLGPLTALAAVAAVTTRLRIGTLVLCNDLRHPPVLAKEAATLDVLSGGRLELGLGAGFLRRDYEEAGLRFDPPGERVGRLEESIQVLRGLFGDRPLTHLGRHYQVNGLASHPRPVQRPHPPIHVAAAQPRMLGIAARHADIVNLQTVSTTGGVMTDDVAGRAPDAVARQVERVREAAGDRFSALELSMVATVAATDRPLEAAAEIARRRGWSSAAEQVLAMPSMLIGPPDRVIELLHERRETLGISYYIVSDSALDAVTPLLERVRSAGL